MKALSVAVFLVCTWPGAVWPQAQSAPTQDIIAPTAPSPPVSNDIFERLRIEAERLQHVWEKVNDENLAQVERLLHSKICQNKRIYGLLERTQKAMDEYLNAAKKYWEVWGIKENKAVDDQKKQLASMVADQERTKVMQEDEKKNRELLEQKAAALDQSTRTEDVRKQIEDVKKDIIESEAHLEEARRRFESLTVEITNINDSILAQVMKINQNSARLEAFGLDQTSFYDDKRKEAQAVCVTWGPGMGTPPPKRTAHP